MRNAGRLKLGYFPLPTEEGHWVCFETIRRFCWQTAQANH